MPRVEQIEVAWKIKVRGNTARLHTRRIEEQINQRLKNSLQLSNTWFNLRHLDMFS